MGEGIFSRHNDAIFDIPELLEHLQEQVRPIPAR